MERKIILFLLWINNINYIYSNDVCEDKSLDVEHWHCENNPDGTVNVTYDCLSVPEVIHSPYNWHFVITSIQKLFSLLSSHWKYGSGLRNYRLT